MEQEETVLEMAEDIHIFAHDFKKKYNESISFKIGSPFHNIVFCKKYEKIKLEDIRDLVLQFMHDYGDYSLLKYKSFNNKSRKREFLIWKQCYAYIGYKYGYSKSAVGKSILCNHATIINSISKIEAYMGYGDPEFLPVYNYIIKKLTKDVGITTKDFRGQDNTKSTFAIIRNR